ncbi:MAG TPA: branched-chain amino acid ABC transporter permease [Gaiellaceae bacterium]|jgi:branched-chain amino acid transport system permease protein|nr:branched-chain amino acid ABC transporter permease [Gaiellaceae bacterium]
MTPLAVSFPYLVQQAINALSLGSTYALLALGLAMLFSIMGLINFAHGELLVIGGYTMWALFEHGVPWPVVIPLTMVAPALAAIAMERVAFRPLRGASIVTLLIASFAISLFLQTVFQITAGTDKGISLPSWVDNVVTLGPYTISLLKVVMTGCTILALMLLTLFLRRTLLGIAMRAAAEDFETTRLMGVRANGVVIAAFALSGLLAGLASLFYFAQSGAVGPFDGTEPVVKAFIAVVIGGLGSLTGAVVGGFVLGITEVVFDAALPSGADPFATAFALLVVIGILLLRPQGIVGRPVGLT